MNKALLVLPVLIILFTNIVLAKQKEVSNSISTQNGIPVTIGNASATSFVQLANDPITFSDFDFQDIITFGVDHHYPKIYSDPMDVTITIKVQPYDINGNATTAFFKKLSLDYDPNPAVSYADKQSHLFGKAHAFQVTITAISVDGDNTVQTLPEHLFVQSTIKTDRYNDFANVASTPLNFAAPDIVDTDCDGIFDQINFQWTGIPEAEEYEVEWTFVNDYGTGNLSSTINQSQLDYDFAHNSSRILVSDLSSDYAIPLIFDRGYILYRVRAIGRDLSDPSLRIVGVWNRADQGSLSGINSGIYYNNNAFEASLNWQVNTKFAENQKQNSAISFSDGSLKGRQNVVMNMEDSVAIVSETIYDYQERPAIDVLPGPVNFQPCTNNPNDTVFKSTLKFYPSFNIDDTLNPYMADDFDQDGNDSCGGITGRMDTTSGTSQYYSPYNPVQDGFNAFIPDAHDYPFFHKEYTPDNTGRIRREGSVGPDFQLGSGHEAQYFYGKPDPIQLWRLFGSEVGDAAHYKKNVIVDANGSVTVSYLDMKGRTVASALAGDTVTAVKELDDATDAAVNITSDLLAKDLNGYSSSNIVDQQQASINFYSELLVPTTGNYTFDYGLVVDTLFDPCLVSNVCFNCVYDLTIKITNECGEIVAHLDTVIGNLTITNGQLVFNTNCSNPSEFSFDH
ncbi:MAG: hypothetical protein MRY83_16920, partial [Flavobacteriales bacterium]|nr:hypothetical protein [Flavobacteriales bacterium]